MSRLGEFFRSIFGSDAESETDELLTNESVPYFQRPMTAGPDDRKIGEDDAGNPVYKTAFGDTYIVRMAPDQRTGREKLTDAAEAVVDYVKDPTLPTGQQVKDAAVGAAQGVWDGISIPGDLASGEKSPTDISMGEVFGVAGGMATGATPFTKPDGSIGMFLRADKTPHPDRQTNLVRAKEMAAQGVSDEDIWRDTGMFELNNEWYYEIDDSMSHTKDSATLAGIEPGTTRPKPKSVIPGEHVRLEAGAWLKQESAKVRDRLQKGEIDMEEASRLAQEIEAEYKARVVSKLNTEFDAQKPSKFPGPGDLKTKGRLSEVFYHPELYDEVPELADMTAEIGHSYDKNPNNIGGFYPTTNRDAALKAAGKSRLSVYKNIDYAPQSSTPEGKIDFQRGVLLHEVNHGVSDVQDHVGKGSSTKHSEENRNKAWSKYVRMLEQFKAQQPFKDAQTAFTKATHDAGGGDFDWFGDEVLGLLRIVHDYKAGDYPHEAVTAYLKKKLHHDGYYDVDLTKLVDTITNDPVIDAAIPRYMEIINSKAKRIGDLPEDKPMAVYNRNHGEALSNMTEERRDLSAQGRAERHPKHDLRDVQGNPLSFDEIWADKEFDN